MTRIERHRLGRAWGLTCLVLTALLLVLVPMGGTAAQGPDDLPARGAYPRITQSVWTADPSGALSPRQALSQAWAPYRGALARGFKEGAIWIRLTIDTSADVRSVEGQRLVLFIEPSQLDEVSVYLANRLAEPLAVVGDTAPRSPGQPGRMAHIVELPAAVEPFEVLLRVRNQSTNLISVQVLRWDEAVARDTDKLVTVVAFLVFDLCVAIGACLVWLNKRDLVLGLFIVHQLTAFLLVSTLQGLARSWTVPWLLSPGAVDVLTSATVPAYAGVTALLNIQLLRDFGAREPERRWLPLCLVPPVLGALLMILGFRRLGLLTTNGAAPILISAFIVVAWRCRVGRSDPTEDSGVWRRAGIAGAYALMAALTLPQSLRILGLLSDGSTNFNFHIFYTFVITLLMVGLLGLRAADRERKRREMEAALVAARHAARIQQERAMEQSELLTLLAHELKTPLSVVSLALDESVTESAPRAGADRAVRAMKNVIDRCTQIAYYDQRTSHAGLDLTPEPVDAIDIVPDLVALQASAGRVDFVATSGMTACHTDRKLLEVILGNLLDNALKYSPPEARVVFRVVTAARDGRPGVLFSISNPPGRAGRPDTENLFRKYHRGSRARYCSGSGLGLYLSKRLADRLGGQLQLIEGENVTFELWIPLRLGTHDSSNPDGYQDRASC